jgi:plastocyanin
MSQGPAAPAARFLAAFLLAAASAAPALAQSDGRYSGASSIAGGQGNCWGNAPADATVSGGSVTIRFTTYDGTQANIAAPLGKDGTFAAQHTLKSGVMTFAGKVTNRGITANWKGPTCYGTLDLSR